MAAPLLFTSGLVKYKAVFHNCGTSPVRGWGTDLWQCALMVTLYYCVTGTSGCWHRDLLSHSISLSWHWTNQSLPYHNNAKHQAREWQVSVLKTSAWLDQGSKLQGHNSNLQPSDSLISQNGRPMLYSFGHPDWLMLVRKHRERDRRGGVKWRRVEGLRLHWDIIVRAQVDGNFGTFSGRCYVPWRITIINGAWWQTTQEQVRLREGSRVTNSTPRKNTTATAARKTTPK